MIKRFELRVKVLTPLHIGTGQKLTESFDYVCHHGRTYRLNLDALAAELYARDPKLTEQLLRTPPGQLLKPEDLRPDAPYVRYVLGGTPSVQEFREALKDAHDRPYIPGSSLKGALRTVIAWKAWKELELSLSLLDVKASAKFAAKLIEKTIFGPDPNHDLLRALRLSDSKPEGTGALGIYQVRVWTARGGAAPISLEAINPETEFVLEATIDETLFSEWAKQARGFPFSHRDWLDSIPEFALRRAKERLEREIDFWQKAGLKELIYPLLKSITELKKQGGIGFPLQLGFGTGWEGTTIGAPLKEDPQWQEVHQTYNLGRAPRARGQTPPDEFPRSRRVVVDPAGKPMAPLGWVWIQWKEVGI